MQDLSDRPGAQDVDAAASSPSSVPQRRTAPAARHALIAEALEASKPVSRYVKTTWRRLRRSFKEIYLGGCVDPKMPAPLNLRYAVYISEDEDMERVQLELKRARQSTRRKMKLGTVTLAPGEVLPTLEIRRLPPKAQWSSIPLAQQGLLYLPNPYIVPGVRFNEMYNWDSIFVARGLLESCMIDDAKWLVDNLLYESAHYGTILNGNRTYYLSARKSRSQPPLITTPILPIFDNWHKLHKRSRAKPAVEWLRNAAALIENYYEHWVTPPHLHEESGLSRYSSFNDAPAPEVTYAEPGHYEGALDALIAMYYRQAEMGPDAELGYQDRKDRYYIEQFLYKSEDGTFALSPEFYRGDAAMRESGFDPSRRFGFYNVDLLHYLPVCLNSLRFKMEADMAKIYERLELCDAHAEDGPSARHRERRAVWQQRADATRQAIHRWLWDDGVEDGAQVRAPCFRDRNTNIELCRRYDIPLFRSYNFAAFFFPLATGAATPEQAAKTVEHLWPILMTPYGLNTSDRQTGCQWDSPLIWAPLQVMAVEALERYHFYGKALELALAYLGALTRDFRKTGKLWEKYECRTGSSDIQPHIDKGYFVNDEGFAWTNAAVIEMRAALKRLKKKIKAG